MAFVFTGAEILDMVIMTAAAGYIFMDFFQKPSSGDPVSDWQSQTSFWDRFLYSVMLVAPAILLHEFGHKFVAMYFGLSATFHAAYFWLAIGVAVKLLRFPFIFFIPAYVSVAGAAPGEMAAIAFAGPAVNLVIGVGSWVVRRFVSLTDAQEVFWRYTQYINLVLFVFNMIPFPGFDGSKVFGGLAQLF